MNYREVLALPIRTFWLMSSCINRIQAEFDIRHLSVAASAQSGEGFSDYRKQLVLEIGMHANPDTPANYDTTRDQEGFSELKMMAAMM